MHDRTSPARQISGSIALAMAIAAVVLGLAVAGAASAQQQRATGLVMATPDELRGVPLASTPYSGAELPAAVDLSADMPPPQDQGQQNSCVGWAVAYALKSYQEHVEEHQQMVSADGRPDARRVFSPAFIYNQLNNGRDGGVSYIAALNLVREQGAATWDEMPYDTHDYQHQPSAAARGEATRYRIDTWRQVNVQDTREIKAHLSAGFPVLIGARVDQGFLNEGRGATWTGTVGAVTGAHAMVLVGYDDSRQAFKLINSWGRSWGDDGYGWVSYQHLGQVANEAYVAHDARNGPPPVGQVTTVTPPQPPPPTQQPQLTITNVTQNAVMPDNPGAGYFMRIDGWLVIPPGLGSSDQVVIAFWFDAGGGQPGVAVRSTDAAYATVDGQAACGTARYPIPAQGLQTPWAAWIPYSALYLSSGGWVQGPTGPVYQPVVSYLVAQPVLYIDNFGVLRGAPVQFAVSR